MKNNGQAFENYIVEELKQLDIYARRTKGSGNKGEKGDIKLNTVPLHIECKDYNKLNVYDENHMKKCIEEVPLHSDKLPLLITKNKNNDIRVHISWLDFKELYFEYYKLKYGEE